MKRIHIMQASMQRTDTQDQKIEDLRAIFSEQPDVVGFTEMLHGLYDLAKAVADEYDYTVFHSGRESAIALRGNHRFLSMGYDHVHDRKVSPTGSYPARGIVWLAFDFFGETVFFHEGHWITHPEGNGNRMSLFNKMTYAMKFNVIRHGRGSKLSFFGGDVNVDAKTNGLWPFKRKGLLLTIWEELNAIRPTHGRKTYDMVGRYRKDRRVTAHKVVTWLRNSDHRAISVYYDIK